MKKQAHRHGEVRFFEVDRLPVGCSKVIPNSEMITKGGLIVGKSETSGNHHCVELKNKVSFFEECGVLYMKNDEPTRAFCSLDSLRHPDIELPAKVWRIRIAKEFDLLERVRRNVTD